MAEFMFLRPGADGQEVAVLNVTWFQDDPEPRVAPEILARIAEIDMVEATKGWKFEW